MDCGARDALGLPPAITAGAIVASVKKLNEWGLIMSNWIVIVALIAVGGFGFMLGLFFGTVHIDDDAKEPLKGSLFDANTDKAKRKEPTHAPYMPMDIPPPAEMPSDEALTTDSGQRLIPSIPVDKLRTRRHVKKT